MATVNPSFDTKHLVFAEGEWVARKCDFKDGLVTIGHFGDWRVGVETGIEGGNYRDWEGGSDESHARLFAAAPDLLDALLSLDERLRACMNDSISVHDAYDSFYQEVVSEAIAKATGAKSDD